MRWKKALISKMDYYEFGFGWRSSLWHRMPLSLHKYWIFLLEFCYLTTVVDLFTPAFMIFGFEWPNLFNQNTFHSFRSKFATFYRNRWKINTFNENTKDIERVHEVTTVENDNQKKRRRRVSIARVTPLSDSQFSYENENGVEMEKHFHYWT